MGIYIKGMEMPKNGCDHCFLRLGNYCRQIPTDASMVPYAEKGTRHPDCPLVPVPPHGRLIDADKYEFPGDLKYEPTVIPAEEVHNG